ncbi:MAG: DHA2 family efflux MFS transporter permease subunit [Streptomycetaceae bacterium]|nr:DHA2 family efflux MFS transporter permease subunit [Streptomycetaceae bacterium]
MSSTAASPSLGRTAASPPRGGTAAAPAPGGRLTHRQILTILSGLMLGMFLAALDQTIVSTSIRTIADDLHGLSSQAWVTTAYLITSTIATPLYGKLSDLYGRKPYFLAAISIFIVGSAACSFSTSMTELAAFRAFQGLGAGGLMSLAFAIIADIVPPRERAHYQGYMLAMFGTSSVIGPLVGGFLAGQSSILSITGWRWVFLVNVPIGIVALFVVAKVLNLPHTRRDHRIDWWGALTITIGVVPLLIVAEQGREWGWTSTKSYLCYGIGLVGLIAWVFIERAMGDNALIPMRLFRNRVFSQTSLLSVIVGMGMFGGMLLIPLYLQIVKGVSPTKSGLMMLPLMVGMIAGTMTTGMIIAKTGRYKIYPILGTVLIAAAMFLFSSRVQWDTPLPETMAYMGLFGIGLGLCMQVLTLAVQNAVEPKDMGAGTASATFFRQMGATAGTAIFLSALFTNVGHKIGSAFQSAAHTVGFQTALHDPAVLSNPANAPVLAMLKHPSTGGGTASGVLSNSSFIQHLDPRLAEPFKIGFTQAMHVVFVIGAIVIAVGFFVALWIKEVPLRKVSGLEARAAENGEALAPADAVPADAAPAPEQRITHVNGTVRSLISGHVLDDTGSPVPQAVITLIDVAGKQLGRTRTDENGRYALDATDAGTYVLIGSAGARKPQAATVVVGDSPVELDLVLGGTAGLTGVVKESAGGTSLPGALVVTTDVRGEVIASGPSDADGTFAFADLVPGSYTLAATAANHRPAALPVEVTSSAPSHYEIHLDPGTRIRGVIHNSAGKPLDDAQVTLVDAAGNVVATSTTGPDGEYGFTDLATGNYTVIVSGYAPVATPVRLDSAGLEGFDVDLR